MMKAAEEWAKERYAQLAASTRLRGPPMEDFIRAVQADAIRHCAGNIGGGLAYDANCHCEACTERTALYDEADRLEGK